MDSREVKTMNAKTIFIIVSLLILISAGFFVVREFAPSTQPTENATMQSPATTPPETPATNSTSTPPLASTGNPPSTMNVSSNIYWLCAHPDENQEQIISSYDSKGNLIADITKPRDDERVEKAHATWSPNRTEITYSIFHPGEMASRVVRMNADGANVRELGMIKGHVQTTSWSPDGKTIVFNVAPPPIGGQHHKIWLMDADGKNQRQITFGNSEDAVPQWSPDGKHITFTSDRDGHFRIYAMKPDGSSIRDLTNITSRDPDLNPEDKGAAWSSDAKQIVYWSGVEAKSGAIWSMSLDTNLNPSNPKRLTFQGSSNPKSFSFEGANSDGPSFLPDGKIIFGTARPPVTHTRMFTMNRDGSNQISFLDFECDIVR